nr:maco-B 66 [Mamestra configurata nucleopolyhedrovirus B]WRQ96955.1 macoB66 [Mamestra configurata nucleopolyhedrovirus B]
MRRAGLFEINFSVNIAVDDADSFHDVKERRTISIALVLIQQYNMIKHNKNSTETITVNVSQMFCCYTLRCVLLDGLSYCIACASLRMNELDQADIRFQHHTLNELSSRNSTLMHGDCSVCSRKLATIVDASDCRDCLLMIGSLYGRAIDAGFVDVVRETLV